MSARQLFVTGRDESWPWRLELCIYACVHESVYACMHACESVELFYACTLAWRQQTSLFMAVSNVSDVHVRISSPCIMKYTNKCQQHAKNRSRHSHDCPPLKIPPFPHRCTEAKGASAIRSPWPVKQPSSTLCTKPTRPIP